MSKKRRKMQGNNNLLHASFTEYVDFLSCRCHFLRNLLLGVFVAEDRSWWSRSTSPNAAKLREKADFLTNLWL
jgi:hypothetical protein